MSDSIQAFTLQTLGNWPEEKYKFTPVQTYIDYTLGEIGYLFTTVYINNPATVLDNPAQKLEYVGVNNFTQRRTLDYLNASSNIVWNVSSVRINDYGHLNQFFKLTVGTGQVFNYIFSPKKLFLKPISIQKISANEYRTVLSAVLIKENISYISVDIPENIQYAPFRLAKYVNGSTVEYERISRNDGLSTKTLFYDISSSQTIIKRNLISYSRTNNPSTFTIKLENNNYHKKLRKDYNFFEGIFDYESISDADLGVIEGAPPVGTKFIDNLNYYYYDSPLSLLPYTRVFNFYYDTAISPEIQTFSFVQSSISTFEISAIQNSIINTTLNLNSSILNYNVKTYSVGGTLYNVVTGRNNTNFTVSYIVDYANIINTLESVQNTVLGFKINDLNSSMGIGVLANTNETTNNDKIEFTTKYPPYYYSFNASAKTNKFSNTTDDCNLTFHLSSVLVGVGNNDEYVDIKTYLYSDFNAYQLDLATFARSGDKIKYNVKEYTGQSLINDIRAEYFNGTSYVSYDLNSSPWVEASSGSFLRVYNPLTFTGNPILTIRSSLSTLAGLKDALYSSKVSLIGLYESPKYPLAVRILNEGSDFIDLAADTMVSDEIYPGINLTNSNISWKISPDSTDVKLTYLLYNESTETYNPINSINKNTTLPFNQNTWAVRVSGYGPVTTTITFSSQKENDFISLSSDPALFDYFEEKRLIIGPKIELNNLNQTRTITLTAKVPYKNRIYDLPKNVTLYWDWTYNNTFNLQTPITAYKENDNVLYESETNGRASSLSSMYFEILPSKTSTPINNVVRTNVYTIDTFEIYNGQYTFNIDNFPSEQIFNADFTAAYPSYPNDFILNTRNGQNVLTRPNNANAVYKLKANDEIIAITSPSSFLWLVIDANNNTTQYSGVTEITLDATGSWKYTVTLKVNNVTPTGWALPHNVEKTATIYSLPQNDFNKPLSFLIYPEFAWNNNQNFVLLNNSNYTLAAGPTAYNFKKSNTENFYVSANPGFTTYKYTRGNTQNLLGNFSTQNSLLTIPYNNEYLSNSGVTVYLTGYNEFYPQNTPLFYQSLESGNLVTRSYNITARTIPFSSSTPTQNLFFQNPKAVDYNSISYTFSSTITSYDTDFNRIIFVRQKFETDPLKSPATILSNNSTITYILSAPKWLARRSIPAINGEFPVFTLKVGDDLTDLTINGTRSNTLQLNASADLNIKIQPTTFLDYQTVDRDYWNSKNIKLTQKPQDWKTFVAFTTSTKPEIYLNIVYTLTGTPVFVEFNTPQFENNPIIAYNVNFGESENFYGGIDTTFSYSYSSIGTYYVTYSAIYQNSKIEVFTEKVPFIVKNNWLEYDQETVRVISEVDLTLPYTQEQIEIQPNEFGDADIFNTSLIRLDECLNYLKNNVQTMNVDSPITYYGWLGTCVENRTDGIRWYTETYGFNFYSDPNFSASEGTSYFTSIKDFCISQNYILVLDDRTFRLFKKNKTADEITFNDNTSFEFFFTDPKSIAISDDETSVYVADSIKNKIYRFDLDLSDVNNAVASLVLTVGTFGDLNDAAKFDFPSEIYYFDENVFILDFNNNCIKQYSRDLSWIFTYYNDVFENDQLLNFCIHPNGLIYIITKNLKVYVFDNFGESPTYSFTIDQIGDSEITKATFDENGDFIYISTNLNVFKYSAVGEYITTLTLPSSRNNYISIKPSENRSINIATKTCIIRVQDFVEIYKIGDGLDYKYWSLDQILLKKNEFAQDINYNVSLNRTAQNLKTFRNSLNSKFVLVTEQTPRGAVSYFSLVPLSTSEKIEFLNDVENESLFIGTNEFYIPSVINREIKKLYSSMELIKTSLNVTTAQTDSGGEQDENPCSTSEFCWSWKSLACYNLSLPLIRICSINPITYAELMDTFPVQYAPTKTWGDATSNCCNEYVSPLN